MLCKETTTMKVAYLMKLATNQTVLHNLDSDGKSGDTFQTLVKTRETARKKTNVGNARFMGCYGSGFILRKKLGRCRWVLEQYVPSQFILLEARFDKIRDL